MDIVKPIRQPLDRNRLMVIAATSVIATPKSEKEELRSGTWMTIRYAKEQKRTVYIVYPNGEIFIP